MQYKHLCLIFGLTPSVCGCAINWMLWRMVRLLNGHLFAKVKFPDNLKMREYADMIQAREPLADDVIGFMDGVSFQTECTSKRVQQNAFYCGYDCDTMVNNVFTFGSDGKFFLPQLTFLEAGLTAIWQHVSCIKWREGLGVIRYVLIRAFLGAGMLLARSLGRCLNSKCGAFTVTYATICYQ